VFSIYLKKIRFYRDSPWEGPTIHSSMCSQIDPCIDAKHPSNQPLLESIPRFIQRAKHPIRNRPVFEFRIIHIELNHKSINQSRCTGRTIIKRKSTHLMRMHLRNSLRIPNLNLPRRNNLRHTHLPPPKFRSQNRLETSDQRADVSLFTAISGLEAGVDGIIFVCGFLGGEGTKVC
jgi:hypothetical protein